MVDEGDPAVVEATTGAIDPFGTRSTLRIQNAVGGWRKIKGPPSPSVNGRSNWQEVASYLLPVSATSIAEGTACVAAEFLERGQSANRLLLSNSPNRFH